MDFDLENPLQNSHDPPTSLFFIESHHIPPQIYFHALNSPDFDFFSIRREVISLISQLSCTLDPLLSYLAVNYVDRFLGNQGASVRKQSHYHYFNGTLSFFLWHLDSKPSNSNSNLVFKQQPKPWILRLIAVSCLSLAAKMMRTELSVSDIQGERGMIFEAQTVGRMESLVLGALQWRMRSITPFSFIPFFLGLFRLKDLQVLKDRASEIIIRSQREIRLLEFKPSEVAVSALLSASRELLPSQYPCLLRATSDFAYVNKESIVKCNNVIQDITMEGYEPAFDLVSSLETPINVLDHFLSSESEKTCSTTMSASTLRQEKDIKKRKIVAG